MNFKKYLPIIAAVSELQQRRSSLVKKGHAFERFDRPKESIFAGYQPPSTNIGVVTLEASTQDLVGVSPGVVSLLLSQT